MITGDVNCGAAAMGKPEHSYFVSPNVGPSGGQVGCGEHILRALAKPYLARIAADIPVAPCCEAIEPQGGVSLRPHQRRPDG
jgi:hypothetical protein